MKLFLICISILCFGCTSSQTRKTDDNSSDRKDMAYTFKSGSYDGIGKYYMSREIAHVMGAAASAWLERPERDDEESTELAISKIPLDAKSVVADLGAGTGYYSFKIAKKIPLGKVYAIDVQDEMLRQLKAKKLAIKDSVVEVIKGSEQSINLPASSTDLVIMVDVYHELSYPKEILESIFKALRPSGKILLLEYRQEDPSIPIKELHKMSVQQVSKEMDANGFKLLKKEDFLPIQHFLLYEKK